MSVSMSTLAATLPQAPPAPPGAAPPSGTVPARKLEVTRGPQSRPTKVVIYGPGGAGKTSLVAAAASAGLKPLVVDLDRGSHCLDVARIEPSDWGEFRAVLRDNALLGDFSLIAVDSLTRAEELCAAFVLKTVANEKGDLVQSIEGYGYGKGYTYVADEFSHLLSDLDALVDAGVHVVGIAHDTVVTVPNPAGEDFLQHQPRLQSPPKSGQSRQRVREWCDHLIFIDFDRHVGRDGKARGGGTRTIYAAPQAHFWAKSRSLSGSFPYPLGDATLWRRLLGM